MVLQTRPPTGKVPPPVILLEGETGSGRSWTAAEFSASPKVGRTYWIELGDESTADQYGAIPNVRYEIVEPGNPQRVWDWHALYGACDDFRAETWRAAEAGELPPVLVVDQIGAVWDMLGEWADNRARSSRKNKELLAEDPNAEIDITSNYWNDANARWRKLISLFLTSKGIVVILSRGEEVTAFENGKPTQRRTWKVAGQKSLPASMPIWVRLTLDGNPRLIKLRAVVNGIRPGEDRAQPLPSFSLEKLIFDRYGWDPASSGQRSITPLVAGDDAPESARFLAFMAAVGDAPDEDAMRRQWEQVKAAVNAGDITGAEGEKVREAMRHRATALSGEPGPSEKQHSRMHALWRQAGFEKDRDGRLAFTSEIIGRPIESSSELTGDDADKVIARLAAYVKSNTPPAAKARELEGASA